MNTNLVTYLISDLAVNPCDTLDKYLPSTVLTVYEQAVGVKACGLFLRDMPVKELHYIE